MKNGSPDSKTAGLVYTALICYYIVDIVKIEVGAV